MNFPTHRVPIQDFSLDSGHVYTAAWLVEVPERLLDLDGETYTGHLRVRYT